MVELVQSYRELCNSIDRVAGRPFVPNIDVKADDYPVSIARILHLFHTPLNKLLLLLEVHAHLYLSELSLHV